MLLEKVSKKSHEAVAKLFSPEKREHLTSQWKSVKDFNYIKSCGGNDIFFILAHEKVLNMRFPWKVSDWFP